MKLRMLQSRKITYIITLANLAASTYLLFTWHHVYYQHRDLLYKHDTILRFKDDYNRPSTSNNSVSEILNWNEHTLLSCSECRRNMSSFRKMHNVALSKLNACNQSYLELNNQYVETKVKLNSSKEEISKLRQCGESTTTPGNDVKNVQASNADKVQTEAMYARLSAAEEPRMFRDLYSSRTSRVEIPGDLPSTVHYVWCEHKDLKFEDLLGIFSIVRILNPLRLVFYYNHLPGGGGFYYYSWFFELRQSVFNLDLRKIDSVIRCNTMDAVEFAIEQIQSSGRGGFYFGEKAVLTYVPEDWKTKKFVTYSKPGSLSSEGMIVLINQDQANKNEDLEMLKKKVLTNPKQCLTPQQFDSPALDRNVLTHSSPCVVLPSHVLPENILNNTSDFNAVLRWLYYGRSESLHAKQSMNTDDLVPPINHVIFLNPNPGSPVVWSFESYICVISALYVGGFERVYVHGDTRPSGYWWEKLIHENVTFVYVDQLQNVFQQALNVMAHRTDVLRVLILFKYGGTYNDNDVIWVKPLSESQRRYPTVLCYEWVDVPPWPRAISNGLLVSRAGAPFLLKVLESFWFYRDDMWAMNSVLMYYKLYERNPDMAHIDPKLQVICYNHICHPTWHEDYRRGYDDPSPTTRFNIEETNAFHFIHMNAPPIFTSFSAVKNKTSIDALLLRRVTKAIQKAGRTHLLEEIN